MIECNHDSPIKLKAKYWNYGFYRKPIGLSKTGLGFNYEPSTEKYTNRISGLR